MTKVANGRNNQGLRLITGRTPEDEKSDTNHNLLSGVVSLGAVALTTLVITHPFGGNGTTPNGARSEAAKPQPLSAEPFSRQELLDSSVNDPHVFKAGDTLWGLVAKDDPRALESPAQTQQIENYIGSQIHGHPFPEPGDRVLVPKDLPPEPGTAK